MIKPQPRTNIPLSEGHLKFGQELIKTPFPHTAPASSLQLKDLMIVLYQDAHGGYTQRVPTCNVVSFSSTGFPRWAIQPVTPLDIPVPDHFVKISADEKTEELYAITRSGRKFLVNRENGQLIREVT